MPWDGHGVEIYHPRVGGRLFARPDLAARLRPFSGWLPTKPRACCAATVTDRLRSDRLATDHSVQKLRLLRDLLMPLPAPGTGPWPLRVVDGHECGLLIHHSL